MARQAALCSLLAFLLISSPFAGSAAVTCGSVAQAISPCINYVRGIGPLTAACCSGVKGLIAQTTTTPSRQTACACLKNIAAKTPGLKPALAAGLPSKCGTSAPFPISTSTDCSKVR
ncbi:non-specific lipid-transfer protein 1-like [Iris pallida]|uniref:Non-specific lipid-transfer protein n=1 Tax=Iris pallida TaxID=29817 RepID=A0AAX6ELH4_IRIPA|nr:non-specific lipid-transfer protein 1-like [Iris pallida]